MSELRDDNVPLQDELTALKTRADLLGIPYHPSIGLEKLREKVNAAALAETKSPAVSSVADEDLPQPAEETEAQARARMKKEANELIRIRVTCMNPAKAEWEGEVFTCGNSVVGSFTKFVPFNIDEGWHVPKIIYQMMKDRQCQIFVAERDARGNTIRKGKLIKEFAIEVLDPLTPAELQELARRQALAQASGE